MGQESYWGDIIGVGWQTFMPGRFPVPIFHRWDPANDLGFRCVAKQRQPNLYTTRGGAYYNTGLGCRMPGHQSVHDNYSYHSHGFRCITKPDPALSRGNSWDGWPDFCDVGSYGVDAAEDKGELGGFRCIVRNYR